jgi:hypothetical protein
VLAISRVWQSSDSDAQILARQDGYVRTVTFISETSTLLVLTATQRVYSIPLADAKTMTAEK